MELGINFIDTASTYSDGTSEEIVGRALLTSPSARRSCWRPRSISRCVLARTAAACRARRSSANRRQPKRLGTDYVDLYQIHRWDYDTPIEETLEALHDLVKSGKTRYIGASSMFAWQFAKSLYAADAHGWTRFASMQNHLNLLYREEEREMLPLCAAEGIGIIPWSPMARGRLTRDWSEATKRSETDQYAKTLYTATEDADRKVVERVAEVAKARGVPRAQVALGWVLAKPGVTAPIISPQAHHLTDAVAAGVDAVDGRDCGTRRAVRAAQGRRLLLALSALRPRLAPGAACAAGGSARGWR